MRSPAAVLAAALAGAACARAPAPPAPSPDDAPPELKLPRDIVPLRYALELAIDPERDEGFTGSVTIDVDVRRAGATVWLHARDLAVRAAAAEQGGRVERAEFAQLTPEGLARLTPARPLAAGRAKLRLAFEGGWNERLMGLFRARAGGAAYAFTHLEPIDARRVFPCFDEPAFKTPFDVALTVPAAHLAVSNGRALEESPGPGGTKRVRFATTAPLPTYLFFAGVGPFEVAAATLPPNDVRRRPLALRVVAPREALPRLAFALRATEELVPILERWFGIPFPYEKLDEVVSPEFAFGGMENAGAILYADERLAWDGGRSAEAKKIRIGALVAHEVAHQWFGDLVTLGWWDDVWLNESFATFMTWKALETWRPDAEAAADAAVEVDRVMRLDALTTTRAVRQPLARPEDVHGQFDALSYVKGAAAMRGVERLVGEARFRKAIRGYLQARAHATGDTAAVVAALSREAGVDLGPALGALLDRPGVPLVEARAACDAGGARVELAVRRWVPLGSRAAASDAPWEVPVCVRYGGAEGEGEACALTSRGLGAVALPTCPAWIMPAAGGAGYHRWWMPSREMQALRERGLSRLAPAERVSYALALRAAAQEGTLRYRDALDASAALAGARERAVALAPLGLLREALDHLVPDVELPRARAAAAALYRPRLAALGLQPPGDEPLDARRLRHELAAFLSLVAREPAVARAYAVLGRAYADGPTGFAPQAVSGDLADVALEAAVAAVEGGVMDLLLARLEAVEDPERRERIVAALSAARAPADSARALALAGDRRLLRPHERARPLLAQAAQRETREAAYEALARRFEEIAASVPQGLAAALPDAAASLCDRARAVEVKDALSAQAEHVPGAARHLAQAVERIELCAALADAQSASARAWFAARAVE
jgi:alanyl aminopeptidase